MIKIHSQLRCQALLEKQTGARPSTLQFQTSLRQSRPARRPIFLPRRPLPILLPRPAYSKARRLPMAHYPAVRYGIGQRARHRQ